MHHRSDRRVQRSRQLLGQALGSLIREKRFDRITVQEIIDRANVGRTTFYAHFESKEDLFLAGHGEIIRTLSRAPWCGDGAWRSEPSPDLIALLEMFRANPDVHFYLSLGSDRGKVYRLLTERVAQDLAARLHELFREEDSAIPFAVLARHVAGATMTLVHWWMDDHRTPYAPHDIAAMLHHLNQATLRAALGQ